MSSHGDLELRAAELGADCRDHVLRLLGTWAVLSDLSFSDLLLVTPQDVSGGIVLEVIGQVRPATSATLVRSDLVGEALRVREWPAIAQALGNGEIEWGLASLAAFNPTPLQPMSEYETGQIPAVSRRSSARMRSRALWRHGGRCIGASFHDRAAPATGTARADLPPALPASRIDGGRRVVPVLR